MTLTQLSYILAVNTYRNFAKAAEYSAVTQPTLSMQIQKLENELGVLIFNRNIHPVQPTDIGNLIIDQAQLILQEAARIRDIIDHHQKEVYGKLRIGILPTIAPYLLPLFMDKFLSKYPKVEIIIYELLTKEIVRQLQQNILDLGIVATPLRNNGIIEKPLYYEPFVCYISKEHPLFSEKKVRVEDITAKNLWLLKEGHCFRDQIVQLCKFSLEEEEKLDAHFHFEGEHLETLKKLVDENFGMTLLPFLAIENLKDKPSKELVREFAEPIPKREVSLIYTKAGLKKHLIDALAQEILEVLPQSLRGQKNDFILK